MIYENCKSSEPIEGSVKINMQSCALGGHQAKGAFSGTISVECPPGETILFEAALGCVAKVGPGGNQYLVGWKGENVAGTPNFVRETAEVSGVTVTVNSSCELAGVKGTKEAKYFGGGSEAEARKTVDGGKVAAELV
jgi:hypothetical protein